MTSGVNPLLSPLVEVLTGGFCRIPAACCMNSRNSSPRPSKKKSFISFSCKNSSASSTASFHRCCIGQRQASNYPLFNYITSAASFQLQKAWPGNHIWIDNCMTSQFYLNNIPYGLVTTFKWHITWPCNHIPVMSKKDQQINTWYRQPPTVPTNEVHEDNVKFYIYIALSVCFNSKFYARYFENKISRVKTMNKMYSIICFL